LKAKEKVGRSLQLKLILTFTVCTLVSGIVMGGTFVLMQKWTRIPYFDYTESRNSMDQDLWKVVELLESASYSRTDLTLYIQKLVNDSVKYKEINIMITDHNGEVLYKPSGVTENQIDIGKAIREALENRNTNEIYWTNKMKKIAFKSVYPLVIKGRSSYVIAEGSLFGKQNYNQSSGWESIPFAAGLIAFIALFYFFTKKKMQYIKELAAGLLEISKGRLNFRAPVTSLDELGLLASSINKMAEDLQIKIKKERELEQTKNELITNVSHDLRTPLTSLVGYLRLAKDKEYRNKEQLENYIEIAYSKSEKLEFLIEDLFEYTKLKDSNLVINKKRVCLSDLLDQLLEELSILCEEYKVIFSKEFPKEKAYISADPDKIVRVFENLMTNAIRHSDKPGKITVAIKREVNTLIVSVQNKGEEIPNENLKRIFDRFYRVDTSRTDSSIFSGSGIGLAIAKDIVEMHDGKIRVKSENGITTFWVEFSFEI